MQGAGSSQVGQNPYPVGCDAVSRWMVSEGVRAHSAVRDLFPGAHAGIGCTTLNRLHRLWLRGLGSARPGSSALTQIWDCPLLQRLWSPVGKRREKAKIYNSQYKARVCFLVVLGCRGKEKSQTIRAITN